MWHVDDWTTARPPTVDVLISAIGMFNDLHWPEIPGLDDFAGTMFHSARWNHDHDLAGERVAVIGSAASAVQFVPEIAKVVAPAARLPALARTGWRRRRTRRSRPSSSSAFRTDPSAADEERTKIWTWVDLAQTFANPEAARARPGAGPAPTWRVVEDPDLRRRLTPDFPYGCKRPLISNDYYPTFNRPNVELVTDPIAKITADAVVTADGRERAVDTIIVATGFDTTKFLSAIDVTGRGGRRIDDAWADGAQAYLGITDGGLPEPVHALRPEHQQRLDHLA